MILKRWLPLAIFTGLAALLAVGLRLDPRHIPSPLINQAAPPFNLPQLHQPQHSLSLAELHGQVSLLNVWASWCIACREEHPLLMQLAENGNISLYGLNYKDQRKDALRWLEFYGNPYKTSVSDNNGRVGIELGVYGVPETFLLDQNGTIRYKHIGPLTPDIWENTLQPLILQLQTVSTAESTL